MNEQVRIHNIKDDTVFGYDITDKNERVWYFIQIDLRGNGENYAIWNPVNRLVCYNTFKEALIYLKMARENPLLSLQKEHVVRSYKEFDFKNIEIIYTEDEKEYYCKWLEYN